MTGIWKGAGSVVLALVLGYGWTWTLLLKDQGFITNSQRYQIFVVLTILFIVQQIYLVLPKPADRSMVEGRRVLTESYLTGFLAKYYEQLKKLVSPNDPDRKLAIVRVNVAMPTRKIKGLFGSYLRIYYYACPPRVAYANTELSLKWKKK
jgi:hypothetical protein